ncbi:hypothetical protein DS745_03410 [Anaerobacillus alkaliphilus]|uniref:Uncharacterized protein n=1 Tax=Anaerobacillus alkaliphilus TaxID=1548597 RepID=A0A4Q0VZ86_9BACI|nr:hypothetical protein [Anaerobacillus alkaliphilus]RXJ04446.1 hypothetical protein DS745_03410 [Anaerobacillus alkaliphilus]
MPVHEFGIIHDFNTLEDYGYYAPKEYKCISVDDDLIQNFSETLQVMKSSFHSSDGLSDNSLKYSIGILVRGKCV